VCVCVCACVRARASSVCHACSKAGGHEVVVLHRGATATPLQYEVQHKASDQAQRLAQVAEHVVGSCGSCVRKPIRGQQVQASRR